MLNRSIDDFEQIQTPAAFKDAMRRIASSVMILTSRDVDGRPHGMAASAVIPVSMDPPSMLVAINRTAGLYPVVQRTRRFCVNLLGDDQQHLLAPFSQSALRAERFRSDDWRDAWSDDVDQLPWLADAPAAVDCAVESTVDYGTHTLFIGRVLNVHCEESTPLSPSPLVWLAGRRAALHLPN